MASKKNSKGLSKKDVKRILPNHSTQDIFDEKEHYEFSQWCVNNEDTLNELEKKDVTTSEKFTATGIKELK